MDSSCTGACDTAAGSTENASMSGKNPRTKAAMKPADIFMPVLPKRPLDQTTTAQTAKPKTMVPTRESTRWRVRSLSSISRNVMLAFMWASTASSPRSASTQSAAPKTSSVRDVYSCALRDLAYTVCARVASSATFGSTATTSTNMRTMSNAKGIENTPNMMDAPMARRIATAVGKMTRR